MIHLLRRLSESAAAGFAKLPLLSPVIQRLPAVWRGVEYPTTPTPFSLVNTNPARHTIIEHLSNMTSHKIERLDRFHPDNVPHHTTESSLFPRLSIISTPCSPDETLALKNEPNRQLHTSGNRPRTLLVYSDGSRMRNDGGKKRTGYGIMGYYMGREVFTRSVGLGPRATVYDAELFALAHASSKASAFVLDKPHIGEVFFYSDSSSALSSAFDPSTHPRQRCSLLFRKNVIGMLGRHPSFRIKASWSPGHSRVVGNGRADALAKRGTRLKSLMHYSTCSHLRHRANEGSNALEETADERCPKDWQLHIG